MKSLLIVGACGYDQLVKEIAETCGYDKMDFVDDNYSGPIGKCSIWMPSMASMMDAWLP